MTGYHEVRRFAFAASAQTILLPNGWKPFTSYQEDGNTVLVCRKWHRNPK